MGLALFLVLRVNYEYKYQSLHNNKSFYRFSILFSRITYMNRNADVTHMLIS